MNLTLGIVVGWMITHWTFISTLRDSHQRTEQPRQIGDRVNETTPVPEPVELSSSQFKFYPFHVSGIFPDISLPSANINQHSHAFESRYPAEVPALSSFEKFSEYQPEIPSTKTVSQSRVLTDHVELNKLIKKATINPDEQQLWQETLVGMPQEAIEDILAFRKTHGLVSNPTNKKELSQIQLDISFPQNEKSMNDSEKPIHLPNDMKPEIIPDDMNPDSEFQQNKPSEKPAAQSIPLWKKQIVKNLDQQIKCLETTASIHAYNLANSRVPWFRRVLPQVFSNGLSGAEMKRTEASPITFFSADHGPEIGIDHSREIPPIVASNHPWDAVISNGYFIVHDPVDKTVFYLRGGRFILNDDGAICIKAGMHEELLTIESSLEKLGSLNEVTISSQGEIRSKIKDEKGENKKLGIIHVARFEDEDVLEEMEPGLFVIREKFQDNITPEILDAEHLKENQHYIIELGKIAKSTVKEDLELDQFTQTLDRITRLKKLRKDVLSE